MTIGIFIVLFSIEMEGFILVIIRTAAAKVAKVGYKD